MKMLITKIVLATSVALGTLIAAEAANAAPRYYGGQAYDAQANPIYGFGPRVTVQPGDVVSGNRVVGRDTDPFIPDVRSNRQNLRTGPASAPGLVRQALTLPGGEDRLRQNLRKSYTSYVTPPARTSGSKFLNPRSSASPVNQVRASCSDANIRLSLCTTGFPSTRPSMR